jgi:hypothetical protein
MEARSEAAHIHDRPVIEASFLQADIYTQGMESRARLPFTRFDRNHLPYL